MSVSYRFTVKEFNQTYPISAKYIETVKNKAELLGLEYSVEEINN